MRFATLSRDERGFTLIELLVVLLIIGILAAIGLMSLTKQTAKGQDAEAKSNARNIIAVVEAAVLTDEHVLTDYVRWLSARLTTLRAEPELVPTLLALTRDRLIIDLPAAGDVVDAATVSRTG